MKIISPYERYHFQVRSYDVDYASHLTIPSLMHYFQEAAWEHAKANHFGYEFMKEQGVAWVLSKVLIRMKEYPVWKDEVVVKTWPKEMRGFLALRDFEVRRNDRLLAEATSVWLIVDMDTKRPKKLSMVDVEPDEFHPVNAIPEKLNKVPVLPSPVLLNEFKVRYSDLDVNAHVNNATYIRWVLDTLPFERFASSQVQELEVNYLGELRGEEDVAVYKSTTEEGELYSIESLTQEKEVCRVRLLWK